MLHEQFAAGALTPMPVNTYALEDVASAHRDIESGQTVGKLILTTGASST